ncbi:unnamed protein product [Sphagnum troendelagicum]|uniref:Uncharacterized protein n=1 Tax=Sphagnum troendelagicum TaxID=128251 RepID=A0ABP0TYQ1_9BRYO
MKTQGDFSRALILSSAMAIPFQPMLVTVLRTFLMEGLILICMKMCGNSAVEGGPLFVADDIYPNTPYIHAAWHVAAVVGVATLNTLLE